MGSTDGDEAIELVREKAFRRGSQDVRMARVDGIPRAQGYS